MLGLRVNVTVNRIMDQYLGTVKPMHEQFVVPTKKQADMSSPEGANRMALALLIEKDQAELPDDSVRSDGSNRELSFDGQAIN